MRNARPHRPDHEPKHAGHHRTGGHPVPPAPTFPPGGAVQAATSAAGGGGGAPELPGMLIVILALTGVPALQRHRIALTVPMPTACSRPLERPG